MLSFLQIPFRCVNSITRRYLTQSHYWHGSKKYCLQSRLNLTFFLRDLHFSPNFNNKLFQDFENSHAFKHLPLLEPLQLSWSSSKEVTSIEELEELLAKNWRQSNVTEIVDAFERIKNICKAHVIRLSDERFDNLVNGLMDHCEKLTDQQILKLLRIIAELPECGSTLDHNFVEVWNCLDDICCWKLQSLDLNTMFKLAEAWYHLGLGRISDFTFEIVDKMKTKPNRLSKNLMLHQFFYLNISRRNTIPFELEAALARFIEEYTADELAIIAMGFFKTRTAIKSIPILNAMIQKVNDDPDAVDEISLAAILKVIRLTKNINFVEQVLSMQDKLVNRIENLSTLSCVHLALVGYGLQIKHEPTIRRCTEKILRNINSVRLKDIERMLLINSTFNEETDLYEVAYKEIHKDERKVEIVQYPKSLGYILHYLSRRKIYSYEFLNKLLDGEYITEIYGKKSKFFARELFTLDCSIDIECPGYNGNRLRTEKRHKVAKWLTDWPPDSSYKKVDTHADKLLLDVFNTLKHIVGDKSLMAFDHVLPHFNRADIILCKDKKTGQFVEPSGLANYILGDVKKPIDTTNFHWYAIVCVPINLLVRNTLEPLGGVFMKERQLKTLGYIPILILYHDYIGLTPEEKLAFISKQIEKS